MIAYSSVKKWFLVLAAGTIVIVASLYGISPYWFAAHFLGVSYLDAGLAHVLRGFTFLYLAFAAFWVYAAFNEKHRNTALLTVVLFPAGLVVGRIISVCLEGRPAPLLLGYLIAELAQAPIAFWVYRLPEDDVKRLHT